MKCRKIIKDEKTNKQNIVWFKSYGKDLLHQHVYTFLVPDPDKIPDSLANVIIFSAGSIVSGKITLKTENKEVKKIYQEGGNIQIIDLNPGDIFSFTYLDPSLSIKKIFFNFDFLDYIIDASSLLVDQNYSEKQQGVRDSLIQRLSVIKNELWYKASYGLPLMDKIKNKGIYDSVIINIITDHPDVRAIVYFNSEIDNHTYHFDFIVDTIYNEEVSISYEI